jgi:Na+-translocating ferredoxin:NAD+ oxidoreductase RnfA subunit
MNAFSKNLFLENPVLSAYLGIGPILLLSNRLIYALVFSAFYLGYFSLLALSSWMVERYMAKSLHFAAKLLMAALFISLGDMIISAVLPLVRADMGILIPLSLSATPLYIAIFPEQDRSGVGAGAMYGNLLGFIFVFVFIALIRELLAFGAVDLNLTPWRTSGNRPGVLMIFSSGFGLLFLLAYLRALFAKVVS